MLNADADVGWPKPALFNTNSILLGITILFVIVSLAIVHYRRQTFYKEMGAWQDSYSAVRPPGAALTPGYFLLK